MKKTGMRIMTALLAAVLLAAGCGDGDEPDETPAAAYKVLGGRLVWCAGSLESLTVPDSASSIGNNAFKDCPSLTKVVIPACVTKIGTGTFQGTKVAEVEYQADMAAWEQVLADSRIAPADFPSGITVRCTDGIWKPAAPSEWQITADGVLVRYTGTAADVTIPDNVTAIGDGAFKGCTGITQVTIPGGVETIGADAFAGCESLAGVDIPASVTDIGAGALPAGTAVTYRGTAEQWDELAEDGGLDGLTVFIIDERGTLTGYRGSEADITVPDGVTAVAGGVFAGHTELGRVTIPAGVTAIGTGAFVGSGITEIAYRSTAADWDALVTECGIAGELDGITVRCIDGTWPPAHTHEWSEGYTDGGDGTHYKTCMGCGATKTEPHAYGDETCTDDGHTKTCSLCTYSATKPHSWSSYTDDGTGYHSRTCAVEGFEAHSESAAHDYAYKDNGDDTHTITCTKCAYSKTEEHRYEDGTCLDCKCPRPPTVYVASTGSDDNSGSRTKPFATIQKAVDTVIAMNDGTSPYTIYVDGTLKCDDSTYIGTNGMADFSALTKKLTLTIKALSSTATLDGGARFDTDGNVTDAGIEKCVIYAMPASGILNLTLENLIITGGYATDNGGGIYFTGETLSMTGCTVSRCKANTYGGGIYVTGSGTFTMSSGTISGNTADTGGGVCVGGDGTFTMNDGSEISGNTASIGGGVLVTRSGTFTMSGGTISGNTASIDGGGVYIYDSNTFNNGGTVTGNNRDDVYLAP